MEKMLGVITRKSPVSTSTSLLRAQWRDFFARAISQEIGCAYQSVIDLYITHYWNKPIHDPTDNIMINTLIPKYSWFYDEPGGG